MKKKVDSLLNDTIGQRTDRNIELRFSNEESKHIGLSGKHKIIIKDFMDKLADTAYITFQLFEKQANKWTLKQDGSMSIFSNNGIRGPEFADFNGDGYYDMTYPACDMGRGLNDSRYLFLFDKEKTALKLINNSPDYPNLRYNKKLKCLDSWGISASNSTSFLKLEKDTLRKFAYVTDFEGERKAVMVDKNGKEKLVIKEKDKDNVSMRYTNYNPIETD